MTASAEDDEVGLNFPGPFENAPSNAEMFFDGRSYGRRIAESGKICGDLIEVSPKIAGDNGGIEERQDELTRSGDSQFLIRRAIDVKQFELSFVLKGDAGGEGRGAKGGFREVDAGQDASKGFVLIAADEEGVDRRPADAVARERAGATRIVTVETVRAKDDKVRPARLNDREEILQRVTNRDTASDTVSRSNGIGDIILKTPKGLVENAPLIELFVLAEPGDDFFVQDVMTSEGRVVPVGKTGGFTQCVSAAFGVVDPDKDVR